MPEPDGDLLVRGGTVVTCDPVPGVRPGADVLIRGGRIASVGPPEAAGDGQATGGERRVIDAAGCLVLPGLIDTPGSPRWSTSPTS